MYELKNFNCLNSGSAFVSALVMPFSPSHNPVTRVVDRNRFEFFSVGRRPGVQYRVLDSSRFFKVSNSSINNLAHWNILLF